LLCGFDLGGRDIHSPEVHTQNKSNWTKRIRAIRDAFPEAFQAVEFVGYNHMPFVNSNISVKSYYQRYILGKPHIPDPEYIALYKLIHGRGEVYDYRRYRVVRVRYITDKRRGWETEYREDVAQILADRGQIEILGTVRDEQPEEPEVSGDTQVTDRMKKETLVKIANIRGIEGAESFTKAELVELLNEEVED